MKSGSEPNESFQCLRHTIGMDQSKLILRSNTKVKHQLQRYDMYK